MSTCEEYKRDLYLPDEAEELPHPTMCRDLLQQHKCRIANPYLRHLNAVTILWCSMTTAFLFSNRDGSR
jgi:hypothetical protein